MLPRMQLMLPIPSRLLAFELCAQQSGWCFSLLSPEDMPSMISTTTFPICVSPSQMSLLMMSGFLTQVVAIVLLRLVRRHRARRKGRIVEVRVGTLNLGTMTGKRQKRTG